MAALPTFRATDPVPDLVSPQFDYAGFAT